MCHGVTLSKAMFPKVDEEIEMMTRILYASAIGSIMYAIWMSDRIGTLIIRNEHVNLLKKTYFTGGLFLGLLSHLHLYLIAVPLAYTELCQAQWLHPLQILTFITEEMVLRNTLRMELQHISSSWVQSPQQVNHVCNIQSLGGCNRCQMINMTAKDGTVHRSNEPLATIASYRRIKGQDVWLCVGQEIFANTD
ncbi:uncharacterized protein [Primulina huaijiensis]|uniref:uncharacterized protein n=1 Tax=Primulina huaijiensis TaxID=1492673 RepID=UPI003CC7077A